MDRNTKLTLAELIRRKEQMLDGRRRNAEAELYIPSLDADIIIRMPSRDVVRDASEMDDGDTYLCYKCIKEPEISAPELAAEFGCVQPMDIVEKLFLPGEVRDIAIECMKLAGYNNGVRSVKKEIKEIKN